MNLELLDRLRADLAAAHYRVDVLDGLWGTDAAAALFRGQTLPARRALARGFAGAGEPAVVEPAVATLARLFVLAETVDAASVDRALPMLGLAGALELGLVVAAADGMAAGSAESAVEGPVDGGESGAADESVEVAGTGAAIDSELVRAGFDLRPYAFVDTVGAASWWIASDLGEGALGRPLDVDHVLGIGRASMTLSGLMLPTPADTVLDLGTGCGIQALHASRFARRVVATDISERALWFAEVNARLNGVESIEFRLGSLFEPVVGDRFDRIVSNPPFVITPRQEGVPLYEYRDGGMVGDALVQAVVRGASAHLEPGGVLQILANWEYRGPDADGLDRVREWVGGAAVDGGPRGGRPVGDAAVDAWVIEREQQAPELYAETWIRDGGTRPGAAGFEELYAAWLDDFAARGVRAVGFGYLLLRRPAAGGATLARYERVPETLGSNPSGLGAHLAACLDGHDWQHARDDAALLRATLVHAPDVTEERHYWPGQDDPVVMTLKQGGGFGRSVSLDTGLAALVGACDGELTVGAIIAALADILAVDETALRAELLPAVRTLLADALLLPAAP